MSSASILQRLKWTAKRVFESHPYGYAVGNQIVSYLPFTLPHEPEFFGLAQLAKRFAKPGLFLDIGANDGKSALSFAKLVKGWRIISVEANPLHEPRLNQIKKNLPNYEFRIMAADETTGKEISLFVPVYKRVEIHSACSVSRDQARTSMENAFSKRVADQFHYRELITRTARLDELDLKPDLVKMDLEGHEFSALKGFANTLQSSSADFLMENNPAHFPEVRRYMESFGYRVFGFNVERRIFCSLGEVSSRNCFFSKRDLIAEQS